MKFIAFILFFSFAAFLSEAVILPFKNLEVAQKNVHHSCSQCKMMQHKTCKKETTKNTCNQCANCPVFAIFCPDHANQASLTEPVFLLKYISFSDRFISNYAADTWKPPNTF